LLNATLAISIGAVSDVSSRSMLANMGGNAHHARLPAKKTVSELARDLTLSREPQWILKRLLQRMQLRPLTELVLPAMVALGFIMAMTPTCHALAANLR
jgi:hypothetical protein